MFPLAANSSTPTVVLSVRRAPRHLTREFSQLGLHALVRGLVGGRHRRRRRDARRGTRSPVAGGAGEHAPQHDHGNTTTAAARARGPPTSRPPVRLHMVPVCAPDVSEL